ncbi:M23 family metallopeptidase [Chlorobium sp. N1]|uniref:M23 family metallopeptidase n=1 Tax=Chlorobium sp. N1 TaxID=2491138 RepID=UPI00103BFEDD|nr:M23 family metallopeptidase [Chlorobium sp. N1]TCD48104.1 M23 family metallopeptidase [Chlorobium sp. N1]
MRNHIRHLRTLLSLFLFVMATTGPALAGTGLTLELDRDGCLQGGFLTVRAERAGDEPLVQPVVQFMAREWKMFHQEDGSWQALVPVENMTEPGRYPLAVMDGTQRKETEVRIRPNGLGVQHITLSPSKSSLHATAVEKSRVRAALRTLSEERYFGSGFLRPCEGETSSIFGRKRSYNGGPATSYHKGIDIAAPQGTPVHSTAGGRVILAGTVEEGFRVNGNTVVVDHGQGVVSAYLHLHSISVEEGSMVEKGSLIGTVGHTGISTGPHLHWGVYLYGVSVDPRLFLVRHPSFLRARR